MNPQVLTQMIEQKMLEAGFKKTDLNFKLIEILSESIITHIQSQAIVQVATTGTANAQSGVGKIK